MSDSEGVHQMRVGLRRFRAAISLFSKLLGDKQTGRIKSELKWLTGELAPARDLDVYVKSKIEPLRGAAPRGMKELAAALASRRHAAFGRAKAAVASQRYRFLLLIRCDRLRAEIGPDARAAMADDPSNGSSRIFSRLAPRKR